MSTTKAERRGTFCGLGHGRRCRFWLWKTSCGSQEFSCDLFHDTFHSASADQQQLERRAASPDHPLVPPTYLTPTRTAVTAHTTTAAADVAHLQTHTHTNTNTHIHTSGVCDSLSVVFNIFQVLHVEESRSLEVPGTFPGSSWYFWSSQGCSMRTW